MNTLHIKIKNEETYQHLLWFLKKLDQEEIQFVEGKNTFSSVQEQLENEIYAIDSGESTLMELDEFDKNLDHLIADLSN
ncbi:hypothetical protein FHG64_14980 [Antarcticibacterium flavum]|uniref:Uncharacterized protein n=1 Tax=Antarcticibacterium flavum TaxID=2058175 RepID=A0A5B7X7A7_9FLAO|nr:MULTISPECIES: hypothetical protein [Antarcticibacterium]MCM4161375.1 hypothetical protein [Antarcticibacterium sp. W02-3]QCY70598.1 hypothetical protein FHG64_14980 [Antarcticibacterium flavum]